MKTDQIRSFSASLTFLALGLAATGAMAHGSRGTEVDTTCTALNGTKPYAANGSTGTARCTLCHQDNRSIRHEPEWTWVQAGPGPAGQNNFCYPQGIISAPASDTEVSKGGTVNLAARGFSPTKGVGAVTYAWKFSDGRADLAGSPQNSVPLPNAGKLVVTLAAADTSGTDPTPDQRTLNVTDTPTVANADSYTVQSGNTLTAPAPGVLANDSGTGALSAKLAGNVAQGVLTLNANGGFDYRPKAGFVGLDSFSYTASNGVVSSAAATVVINVTAAQTLAVPDRYFVQPGSVLSIAAPGVLGNDQGTGALSARLVRNAGQGALALNADGSFSYTARPSFTGTDSFTYSVSNEAGTSTPVKVSLDVGACTDKDGDGYSPEGGSCGPIDCNDNAAAVNPGAREICGNQVDDDCNGLADQKDRSCNGTDCLARLLDNQVRIDSASWVPDPGGYWPTKLQVGGSKAAAGATVNLSDAVSGQALGTSPVDASGNWTFEIHAQATVCRVRAEINGAAGVRVAVGSTADCSSHNGAPPACGVDKLDLNNCLLNWAERSYTGLFAPAGRPTQAAGVYAYRYYPQTKAYLGISSADSHVYYLTPDGNLLDVGEAAHWGPIAGCQ